MFVLLGLLLKVFSSTDTDSNSFGRVAAGLMANPGDTNPADGRDRNAITHASRQCSELLLGENVLI